MTLGLPDEPRWVEAHGIAADAAGWRRPLGNGFALGHDAARLIVISDEADTSAVVALVQASPAYAVLVPSEALAAAVETAGRAVQRALLHTLPPDALPDLEGAMPLPDDASLAHVPAPLAEELAYARARGVVWTTYVDDEPVAFAYAPWRSPRWFDVSVDVLPAARQLGLGAITASAMIRHERAAGREPVWGADEANVASLRLAKRLGFVRVDEIWIGAPA
ncbi:MAG TPA: GNAT family N-acetyltransferase [Kofleriaceae bacterium]|nr:GNAT family N-acetyltransferase [Kofleriaceae bacterium]